MGKHLETVSNTQFSSNVLIDNLIVFYIVQDNCFFFENHKKCVDVGHGYVYT